MCKKIFGVLLGLVVVMFSEKLLTSYAKSFTVNTATKGAEAIFILGGNPKTRSTKVVELVKDGYSDKIYMTFIKKDGATSIFDEAYSLAQYVKKQNLNHVIIVTDAFEKVFKLQGLEVKLEVAPAYNGVYLENNWWKTEKGLRAYIIEPIKFFFYVFNSRNLKSIEN